MEPAWWEGPLLGFDVESTGIDVTADRVVTASLVRVAPNTRPRLCRWLIAVDIDIPTEAQAVHGISTEHARQHGEPAVEVLDVVAADLALAMRRGVPVVGFNLAYDFSILENEMRRNDLPTLAERLDGAVRPGVDAFVLDKHVDPYRKGSRKLTAVCDARKVLLGGAHEASADALAAVRLAVVLARGHTEISEMSLDQLHDAQIGWRREQCESLAAYFARQGKPQHICPHWPICDDVACGKESEAA